jgi:hypothetical protein
LNTSTHRDLVAFGVHALHVRDVVAALHRPLRALGLVGACSRPGEEADSRAGGRAGGWISGGSAQGSAPGGSEQRPDSRAAHRSVGRCLPRRCPGLLESPLTTDRIVDSELLEILPITGKHHHAWTSRQRRASRQKQPGGDWKEPSCPHFRSPQVFTEAPAGP